MQEQRKEQTVCI